jgi:hypothetical protein
VLQSASPDTMAFVNPLEMSDFAVSYIPNAEFDKKVLSQNMTIYSSVYLNESQAIGNYAARWYYRVNFSEFDRYILFSIDMNQTSTFSKKILFELKPPHLIGKYRVDILKGEKIIGIKYFSVK